MKRKKKPSERRERPRSGYDLEMIRDFLDHLLWELRISHHETTTSHGAVNPELVDQLTKYVKKRQTAGLLFTVGFHEKVADLADREPEKYAEFQRVKGELRKSQLICLEALLNSLIPEAMDAAKGGMDMGILQFQTLDDAIGFYKPSRDYMDGFEAPRDDV
jgi:hypothetical protein